MLFDKYAKKAKKIIKFGNFFVKNQMIFIISGASIAAVSTGLCVTKGTIIESKDNPINFVYGEEVSFNAKAFLEDVSYEFALSDSEKWTIEVPKLVGEYKVRAVSQNILSKDKYGQEHIFTISPKFIEISVLEETLVYGEDPTLDVDLSYDDKVQEFVFNYSNLENLSGNIDVLEDTLIISNNKGEDVTNCYDISYKTKKVNFSKRHISVTVNGGSKVYDGTSITCKEYLLSEGELYSEDSIIATFDKSLIEVGSLKNDPVVSIINKDGVNLTNFYDISYEIGSLEVTSRPLLVNVGSLTSVYNGKEQYCDSYNIDSSTSLSEGHYASISSFSKITNVGKEDNTINLVIYDQNDNDVTSNYAITYALGEINITPKDILISTNSSNKIYDGESYSNLGFDVITENGICDGDSIDVSESLSVVNVGEYQNVLEFIIKNKDGEDITSNYNIEPLYGLLKIEPREITIKSNDYEREYDGTSEIECEYQITSSTIVKNHSITVTSLNENINVGIYDNVLSYQIFDGENNVTSNYLINKEVGTLTISKRNVSILSSSVTREYNGEYLSSEDFEITSTTKLVEGDKLDVLTNETILNVGEIDNVHTYSVLDKNDTDITFNYNLDIDYGSLKITPRNVTILTASDHKEYDRTELVNKSYEITNSSVVEGEELIVASYSSITELGEIDNVLSFDILRDNQSILSNYNFKVEYGTLKVYKYLISVATASDTKLYDNEELFNKNFTFEEDFEAKFPDYQIEVVSYTSISDVSKVDNVLEFEVYEGEENVSKYFMFDIDYGTLEITPILIDFTTTSATKKYDGLPLTSPSFVGEFNPILLGNHSFILGDFVSYIDAGEYDNTFNYRIVENGSNKDVTNNYQLVGDYGKLTIEHRKIYISTASDSKTYDKNPLTNPYYYIDPSSDSVLDNHTLSINVIGTITNVGKVSNEVVVDILDENNNYMNHNYVVEKSLGDLVIYPIKLTIESLSASKVYDGTVLELEEYYISEGACLYNQILYVDVLGSILNVGEVKNDFTYQIIDTDLGDVTSNYDVTKVVGKLTIFPRVLEIVTYSASKVYDATPLINDEYYLMSGSVVETQTMNIEVVGTITDVGQVDNDFTLFITDPVYGDVTFNYEIVKYLGVLEIMPIYLYIETYGGSRVYDALPFTMPGHNLISGNVVSGQTLNVEVIGSITDVGTVLNDFIAYVIDQNNKDVTHNYEIVKLCGTLEITPRYLHIKTYGASKVYDALPLSKDGYEIISGSVVSTQKLSVKLENSIVNVGTLINAITWSVTDPIVGDVSHNYRIIEEFGVLEITPRILKVETYSDTKVYDATPLTKDGYKILEGTVVETQDLYIEVVGSITNVGEILNDIIFSVTDPIVGDVSFNYQIDGVYGTLKVTPRVLKVETYSDTKVYDATPLTKDGYKILEGTVVETQELYIEVVGTITDVGEIENSITFSVTDPIVGDVTHNYEIDRAFGILKITPRILKVETYSDTKVYDGTPLTKDGYKILEGTVVETQDLYIEVVGTITNVGKIANSIIFSVTDPIVGDVTYNYKIDEAFGILKITPIIINVKTGSDKKVYDGTPLTKDGYEILSGKPLEGHTMEITVVGTITNVGIVNNNVLGVVIDQEGNDVSENYSFEGEIGKLQVTPIILEYETGSSMKEYDGTPLTNDYIKHLSGELLEGHTIDIKPNGTITEIGEVKNTVEYTVTDEEGNDISDNYKIKGIFGTLVITRISLNITTGSAMKVYDGTPLYCDEIKFDESKILSWHKPVYQVTGEQTEVGFSLNTADFYIYDENNVDITEAYYKVNITYGQLVVYVDFPPEDPEDDMDGEGGMGGGNPSNIDLSGKLSTKGMTPIDMEEFEGGEPMFYVKSSTSGYVYFRAASFGDYQFDSFSNTPTPYDSINALTNPIYLTSRTLENKGFNSNTIDIRYLSQDLTYLTPYYATNGVENKPNDYIITNERGDIVSFEYIGFEYSSSYDLSLKGTEYEELEKEYSKFVHENYLSLPESTREGILKIAEDNNIFEGSPTLIEDVAYYISNACNYNLFYEEYPAGVDVALYFLNEAKEGICQHYSTAATVMYRALGIPARYTVGFASPVAPNQEVGVTPKQAHAWVEVYVDGCGWIPVEVTGSSDGFMSGGGGGGFTDDTPRSIIVRPMDVDKEYDGTPLYAVNEIDISDKAIKTLLNKGYTWDVKVSGQQTELGESESIIEEFTLYNKSGKDVTSNFEIIYEKGKVMVTLEQVILYVLSKSKVYDGVPLEYTQEDVIVVANENLNVNFDIKGSLTIPGAIKGVINKKNVSITDKNGNDVASSYYLKIIEGEIEVLPVTMVVTAGSSEKIYDGEALTNPNYYVSIGKLIEGHRMEVEISGTISEVGSVKNVVKDVKVYDENDNDVTKCYSITSNDGLLTII